MGWILLGILSVLALMMVVVFNHLIAARNQATSAWSDVDVQLQRRHDLVPNLVEVVRGYASHEGSVLQKVVAARVASRQSESISEKGAHEAALGEDLTRLLAVSERYPDLKANGNFAELSTQLAEIESDLQSARRFYNGSVREYNTRCEQMPGLMFARIFSFKPKEFFAADVDSATLPKASF